MLSKVSNSWQEAKFSLFPLSWWPLSTPEVSCDLSKPIRLPHSAQEWKEAMRGVERGQIWPLAIKLASSAPRPLITCHMIDYWLFIGLDRSHEEWKETESGKRAREVERGQD